MEKLSLSLQGILKQIFLLDLVILIKYLDSAVIMASSNPSVAHPSRTKISYFLLQACTEGTIFNSKNNNVFTP